MSAATTNEVRPGRSAAYRTPRPEAGQVYIATAEAARCQWMAVGATEAEAKANLVKAYWRYANRVFPNEAPLLSSGMKRPRSVEAFDEYYGVWVMGPAQVGSVFVDGEAERR